MEDQGPEERRPARGAAGGVHPAVAEAGRQVRPQVPLDQLPRLQGRLQVHAQSHHQDRHRARSSRRHRFITQHS